MIEKGDKVRIKNGQHPEPTFIVRTIRQYKEYTLIGGTCKGEHGEYSSDLVELVKKKSDIKTKKKRKEVANI